MGFPNTVNALRHYTNRLKTFNTHVKGPYYRCFRSFRPQVPARPALYVGGSIVEVDWSLPVRELRVVLEGAGAPQGEVKDTVN